MTTPQYEVVEEYGRSRLTPWEMRGDDITPRNHVQDVRKCWPDLELCQNIDLCECVADFYLLDYVSMDLCSGGARHTTQPCVTAKLLLDTLVGLLDQALVTYFHCAIGGELRHHRAVCERVLSVDRSKARAGWHEIYRTLGPQALLDAAILFREFDHDIVDPENLVVGGNKWADACGLLYMRISNTLGPNEFLNKKVFIDQAFNLQHNTGSFLTKTEWDHTKLPTEHIGYLLDAHASTRPVLTRLLRYCSKRARRVAEEYWGQTTEPYPLTDYVTVCQGCYESQRHHVDCDGTYGFTLEMYADEAARVRETTFDRIEWM